MKRKSDARPKIIDRLVQTLAATVTIVKRVAHRLAAVITMTSATFALALFTLILALAMIVQIRDTRETSKKQLRAYISVLPPVLGVSAKPFDPITAGCVVRNSGQTPAYKVHAFIALKILPTPEVEKCPNPNELNSDPERAVVGPGVELVLWRQPASDVKNYPPEIYHSHRVLYYGRIEYTDVYGVEHWTTFSYVFYFWIPQFYAYGPYNDADKNE